MAGIKCACIYRGKCSCIWIWITITIRIPIPIPIRIRIRQRQSSSSSRSRIIIMHNGHSQRRGKFFPLISAAFVDSRVLSSKLQAPSSQLPGSKGRRQASLVVGWLLDVWTTGPKGGLFCLLHNKKIIPPFCARAAFLLLLVRFYLFIFFFASELALCIIFLLPFLMHLVCGWKGIAAKGTSRLVLRTGSAAGVGPPPYHVCPFCGIF